MLCCASTISGQNKFYWPGRMPSHRKSSSPTEALAKVGRDLRCVLAKHPAEASGRSIQPTRAKHTKLVSEGRFAAGNSSFTLQLRQFRARNGRNTCSVKQPTSYRNREPVTCLDNFARSGLNILLDATGYKPFARSGLWLWFLVSSAIAILRSHHLACSFRCRMLWQDAPPLPAGAYTS